ncbi:hypothetical protein E3T23_14770 [Cryobacterium cheniae]|uniref:Uncharacterized protein n=1 Tax=Cryobacterium cheniae TaxID=1259262 RepID=A0A4R8XIQ5_9MICO|nr:hypothetical protein [Cryobacterium cheniae]TFC75808.1 hypothetical protein E3T23_14770 [Cryobacterium cheniae]
MNLAIFLRPQGKMGAHVPKYGFKLLRVQAFNGGGHTPVNFGPEGEPHYLDRVAEDIAVLRRKRDAEEILRAAVSSAEGIHPAVDSASGDEIYISSDDVVSGSETAQLPANLSAKPPAVVRVDESWRLRSALLMQIQYGIVGDHNTAVDPQGMRADADLTGLATTRPYRALLITPERGTVGFLAVEVISRSHAGADLARRLHNAAVGHNLKLRPQGPVADAAAVRNLVRRGRVKEVELFKTIVTSDSETPRMRRVKLTFPIAAGASEAAHILSRVTGWLPRKTTGVDSQPVDAAQEASALASILWSDAESLEFDDARVHIKSDLSDRRLQPLDRTEGFVYELGEVELDNTKFVHEVASVAQALFDANEMEMEPDWTDWLDGAGSRQ